MAFLSPGGGRGGVGSVTAKHTKHTHTQKISVPILHLQCWNIIIYWKCICISKTKNKSSHAPCDITAESCCLTSRLNTKSTTTTHHTTPHNTAGHNWFPTERMFIQEVRCFASKDTGMKQVARRGLSE